MTKAEKVFDKILKKDNYTKQEVKEILLGTYEGFTAGFMDKQPNALLKAKQEVLNNLKGQIEEKIIVVNTNDGGTYEKIACYPRMVVDTAIEKLLNTNKKGVKK